MAFMSNTVAVMTIRYHDCNSTDPASGPGSNTTIGKQKLPILMQGLAPSAEVDEEKFPVLALYNGEDTELRDLIFETLMERLPISELREHLGGQNCKSSCQLYM